MSIVKVQTSQPMSVDELYINKQKTRLEEFKDKIRIYATDIQPWKDLIKNINPLNLISLISLIISIVALMVSFASREKITVAYRLPTNNYNIFGKLEELKKSHEYYYKVVTPLEKYVKWKTMFHDWRWVRGGDPKFKQTDCVGAVYTYYKSWGSNFQLESVPQLIKRINTLKEKNPGMIRRSIHQIVPGDLIVLRFSEANQHIGVVMGVPNGKIRYVSVNVATMGDGEDLIDFGNSAIVMISEVSYELWIGDLMQELNK